MKQKKRIMILGGGNCQLSAVKRCRARGYATVLADYTQQPPAAAFADAHERVSTFDAAACIAAGRRHNIDAVLTLGTDQPVYTAARVAEALGLPCPLSAAAALRVTNKQWMKQVLDAAQLANAPHCFLKRGDTAAALNGLAPPYVIKPVDSQGQRGVALLDSAAQVLAHLEATLAFSRSDTALVEEYYPNDELTVSGWVDDGALRLLTVTDRLSHHLPPSIGVCYGHRCPTRHIARYTEIEALCRRITTAFDIRSGPVYYQLLLGRDGLLVNEVAARIGGAFEDVFIPVVSGFSILDALIDQSLGLQPDLSCLAGYDPRRPRAVAGVLLLFCRGGRLRWLPPLAALRDLPGVIAAGYQYQAGDIVPPIDNATARLGHCVLVAKDAAELDKRVAGFQRAFRVIDEHGADIAIPCRLIAAAPDKP